MKNLQAYRRRIRAIKDLIQVTKAMKTVSAARLKRSQVKVLNLKPYAASLKRVLSSVAAHIDPSLHPMLQAREESKVALVVVSSDKGLCGAFNSNLLKKALPFIEERKPILICVGKKGFEHLRRSYEIEKSFVDLFFKLNFERAMEICRYLLQRYKEGAYDAIYIAYNQFISAGKYVPTVERYLPITEEIKPSEKREFIFEPSPKEILDRLIEHYIELEFWRVLLESSTAEHAARMIAMDQATRNAQDMVKRLTLEMNKLRQERITKELLDIVTAIEAMRKSIA